MTRPKSLKHLVPMKRCAYCRSEENLTVDHIVPKVKGGSDDPSNLQCLCRRCNTMKSYFSDSEITHIWKFAQAIDRERVLRGKRPRFASKHSSWIWRKDETP